MLIVPTPDFLHKSFYDGAPKSLSPTNNCYFWKARPLSSCGRQTLRLPWLFPPPWVYALCNLLPLGMERNWDLLLTIRMHQRWWVIAFMTILHKMITSALATSFSSLWSWWSQLACCWEPMEKSTRPLANS